jgi:hypothetical protein
MNTKSSADKQQTQEDLLIAIKQVAKEISQAMRQSIDQSKVQETQKDSTEIKDKTVIINEEFNDEEDSDDFEPKGLKSIKKVDISIYNNSITRI